MKNLGNGKLLSNKLFYPGGEKGGRREGGVKVTRGEVLRTRDLSIFEKVNFGSQTKRRK